MLSWRKFVGFLATVFLVAGLVWAGGKQEAKAPTAKELPQVTWKLSHTTQPNSPYGVGAIKLADLVKEKTGGKFIIQVHHQGVLGWEREVLEAMQVGTIEATIPALGPFAVFVKSYDVFNLPFMFRSPEHMLKAFASPVVEPLKKDAEKYGFIVPVLHCPLFRYPLNSVRPIKTLDDFKGLKIRTMGTPAHIDAYKALGANVTTTAFSEVNYTARCNLKRLMDARIFMLTYTQ